MRKRKKKEYEEKLPELKGIDVPLTFGGAFWTDTQTNGFAELLNGLEPGTAAHQRLGNKICLKSLRVQFNLRVSISTRNHNPWAGGAENYNIGTMARIVVVWDQRPGILIPGFDEIFYELRQGGTEGIKVYHPLAPIGLLETSRFRLLRDMKVALDPKSNAALGAGATQGGGVEYYHFIETYINLEGYETTYNELGIDHIGGMTTGALYVYCRVIGTDDHYRTSAEYGVARLRYVEK